MNYLSKKVEERFLDPKSDGLKKETNQRNIFSTLRKRTMKKVISQLSIDEEEITSDFKQINKEIESFFARFYKSSIDPQQENDVLEKFQSFVESLEITSLSEHENEELEHNLSIEELQNALKDFQNNKTPGEGGFTKEF